MQTLDLTIKGKPVELWGIEDSITHGTRENNERLKNFRRLVAIQHRKSGLKRAIEGKLEVLIECYWNRREVDSMWKSNGPAWHCVGYPVLQALEQLGVIKQVHGSRVVVEKRYTSGLENERTRVFIRTMAEDECPDEL